MGKGKTISLLPNLQKGTQIFVFFRSTKPENHFRRRRRNAICGKSDLRNQISMMAFLRQVCFWHRPPSPSLFFWPHLECQIAGNTHFRRVSSPCSRKKGRPPLTKCGALLQRIHPRPVPSGNFFRILFLSFLRHKFQKIEIRSPSNYKSANLFAVSLYVL